MTDKKIGVSTNGTTVSYYNADVVSASDYAPFGAQLPGRTYSSSTGKYRYGFNGQEKDNEIKGEGNTYTAEFWEYDARSGRRWNIDPVPKPYFSGYSAFANNPINLIDPTGADTLKIKGTNNSQWTVFWGKGTASTTYDLNSLNTGLAGFVIPDKLLDIGTQNLNLDELFPSTPDVIGLDIYGGGNIKFVAGGGGLNLLWHTRGKEAAGEGSRPELHIYNDVGVQGDLKNVGVGIGASLIAGWAQKNVNGHNQPASNSFVTNGVNWTGNFNVVNGSFTVGKLWGKVDVSINASKFSGMTLGTTPTPLTEYWWGYSIGVGLGVSATPIKANSFGDILKVLDKTTAGVHQQYYYLMYGNGGDRLNNGEDVSGWHFRNPIDPKDNK